MFRAKVVKENETHRHFTDPNFRNSCCLERIQLPDEVQLECRAVRCVAGRHCLAQGEVRLNDIALLASQQKIHLHNNDQLVTAIYQAKHTHTLGGKTHNFLNVKPVSASCDM
jgi:hypothetical protein